MEEKDIKIRAKEHMDSRMEELGFLYKYSNSNSWDDERWDIAKDFDIDENMNPEDIEEAIYTARNEYAPSWDYMPSGDEGPGYFRYQISWGGPSEEIRMFVDYGGKLSYAEFWFLDWFVGHGIALTGEEFETAEAILSDFDEVGMVERAYEEAIEA